MQTTKGGLRGRWGRHRLAYVSKPHTHTQNQLPKFPLPRSACLTPSPPRSLRSGVSNDTMRLFAAAFAALAAQKAAAFSPVATSTTGRRFLTAVRMAEKTAALSQDELKKMVGYKAVDDYVKSGMVVGLGTGSTAYFAVERLGQLLASGELKDIVAIPTSVRTKEQAESLKIPLVTLDTHSKLDVAIDGADEVDPDLNLVKGGGGALLREKMVEVCAEKFIVIGERETGSSGPTLEMLPLASYFALRTPFDYYYFFEFHALSSSH